MIQNDESVGADAKPSLTDTGYFLAAERRRILNPSVDHDKVISCTVVFGEVNNHSKDPLKKVKSKPFAEQSVSQGIIFERPLAEQRY